MTHRLPASLLRQASTWISRLEDGLCADEQAEFDAWIARTPNAADALAQCYAVLDASASPAMQTALSAMAPASSTPRVARRGVLWAGGFAGAAAVAALIAVAATHLAPSPTQPPPLVFDPISFATAKTPVFEHPLADGSLLWSDADTLVQFGMSEGQRQLTLEQGRVFLQVATDPLHPFVVATPDARVTVTGTAFEVDALGETTTVSVFEGAVLADFDGARVRVSAGGQARAPEPGRSARVRPVDRAAIAAWRNNRLIFDQSPLIDVLTEYNRYADIPITVSDTDVASEAVSGSFEIGAAPAFAETLARLLDLEVHTGSDQQIVLQKRD